MSNNPQTANGEDDLKRKLVLRVAFAGVLIALLLGALAFIDYLGQPVEEPAPSGPTFTSPVPVPRKEVTQPVKPAEPAATAETPKETAKEVPPPPPVVEAPTQAPPPAAGVPPARPQVAAQPALPRQESRPVLPQSPPGSRPPRSAASATPVEGTAAASSQFTPEPEKAAAPPLPPPVAERQPPAPPRLFSGFAVQAGVFADAQHAEELRAKLTLNGIPSTLEARVQVGPFKTREEAEAARQKLKALGIEGILLPPKGAKR